VNLNDTEALAMVRLGHEAGHLKQARRTGWWRAGIRDPESVAEHSWRTAVLGYLIACAEGADPDRTAAICVFHDLAETRTGDIEYVAKHYVTAADDLAISKDQLRDLPAAAADGILGLVEQAVSRGASPEAACAHDADKLECLLQAREYELRGYQDAQTWAQAMADAVRTKTGRALAASALQADPGEWWREANASWARNGH